MRRAALTLSSASAILLGDIFGIEVDFGRAPGSSKRTIRFWFREAV
jgi:hypothetical protein